jgi:hypothetical protein
VGGKGGGGGRGGEMNQALYAHMNNKRKMKKIKIKRATPAKQNKKQPILKCCGLYCYIPVVVSNTGRPHCK